MYRSCQDLWILPLVALSAFSCQPESVNPPAEKPAHSPRTPEDTVPTPPPSQADVSGVDLPQPAIGEWVDLFDGRTLNGWLPLTEDAFAGHGEVQMRDGNMILERGGLQTGVRWLGEFPRENYIVEVEAMRVTGGDFFCGMTFPVGDEPCTLIIGGWGGSVVGLSNVDGMHAAENVTTTSLWFKNDRWYRIRLRVTSAIDVWIDEEPMIHLPRDRHSFDVWWQQKPVRPFGIATYDTASAIRNVRIKHLLPGTIE